MLEENSFAQSNRKVATPQNRPSAPQKRGNRWRIQWLEHTGRRRSQTFGTEKEAWHALERVKGLARFLSDGSLPIPPEPMGFKEF